MSIFNSFAALASNGGLEYEEGTYSLGATSATMTVPFANTHSKPPAIALIMHATYTSSGYSNIALLINYNELLGLNRANNVSYMAQAFCGWTPNSALGLNESYNSNTYTAAFKNDCVVFSTSESYKFRIGGWKWIAIWASEE